MYAPVILRPCGLLVNAHSANARLPTDTQSAGMLLRVCNCARARVCVSVRRLRRVARWHRCAIAGLLCVLHVRAISHIIIRMHCRTICNAQPRARWFAASARARAHTHTLTGTHSRFMVWWWRARDGAQQRVARSTVCTDHPT